MKTLKQFSHEMWLQNCDERAAWSLPVLTEEAYCEQNETYLANEYAEEERMIELENTELEDEINERLVYTRPIPRLHTPLLKHYHTPYTPKGAFDPKRHTPQKNKL